MSAKPESVHPEFDRPTPENIDEWSEEQIDAWNDANESQLEGEARKARQDLSEEQERALDALRPETSDETVQLVDTDVQVAVRTHTNRETEQHIQRVIEEGQSDAPDLTAVRGEMIGAIVAIIKDDDYSNRQLWEVYADEYGITYIYDTFECVAGPITERMEAMSQQQSFRHDQ